MSRTCSRCGKASPETLLFCPACGQSLAEAGPAMPSAAPALVTPDPSTPQGETFDRRRRVMVLALLGVGIAILVAVLLLRPADPPPPSGTRTTPVAVAPPGGPPTTADVAKPGGGVVPPTTVRPPVVSTWQRFDSRALGLVPYGRATSAGVAFEIPADWKRLDMPEAFILGFAPAGAVEGVSPRVLVSAMDLPPTASLAEEAAVVKSMADDGGARFALRGEGARTIAGHEGWRLSIAFKAMDDPDLRRQDLVFVRVGGTAFKILVDGADANAEIGRVFDHVVETLAVKE